MRSPPPLFIVPLALLLCLPALGQDNPITNGSFEALDAQGLPVDWEPLGNVKPVAGGHTGERALLLDRGADEKAAETGLNRRWKPESGLQGSMLSELKGGLEFWYQAPAADPDAHVVVGLIAMNKSPLEGTGAPRAMFDIPAAHVGDGAWHRGLLKYDFTKFEDAKWVHVAARIYGGTGQLLLDDLKWLPSVGPLPRVQKLILGETPGQEGSACSLTAVITNAGDAPLQAAEATIVLPAYLQLAVGPATVTVPPAEPDALERVVWQVKGLRDRKDAIAVTVKAGEQTAEGRLALAPDVVVEQLQAERFLLAPGYSTPLRLIVTNGGNAVATKLTACVLAGEVNRSDTLAETRPLPAVLPGGRAIVEWETRLARQRPSLRIEVEVRDASGSLGRAATELVCAPPFPASLPTIGEPAYARVLGSAAVVGNAEVRLVFARDSAGAPGPAWLQVCKAGAWQTVAALPQLGSLATAPATRGEGTRVLTATAVRAEGGGKQARLVIAGTTPGSNWPCTCTIAARDGADVLDYVLQVTPAADAALYGLRGPMLYVGEGAWGASKDEAILPGLEWLVGDEVSSSTLDIASSMPQRWRWCPPPHAVTIPAMSVHRGDVTVGLLWDHLQQYAPRQTRPRAIFGAPDRFEGRNACLLGLMVPGGADPEWWAPPRLATEKPWQVKAGTPLTIRAQLYVKAGAADALTAVDRWFALYGAPKPERLPHGKTWDDEIALSARGYLDSLWDPKTQKWFASLNGPQQMTTLGWHPPYLYDVIYASRLAPRAELRERCRERIAEVKQLSGQAAAADDFGFEFGNPAAALVSRADYVDSIARSQGADGAWRFTARIEKTGIFAGMDYGELGRDQAAESGTCGASAYTILQYARLTGDPQATAAGLKALEFLNTCSVPRAAQVWEVPVHTPDVLASADVCEAYLEGYRLTGNKEYLQRAVYWARTGLPFCYMWDTPGYEALRYASIPVFGASWYTCNWFGQPVQWNGLRLARAYLALAPYDQSYPWKRIAEGLTVSCLWQQHGPQVDARGRPAKNVWPDDKEKWIGLWPDNFNSVDLSRCPWVFAPRQILDLIYRLKGLHPEPETVALQQEGKTIRLSACAAVSKASWQGDKLSADVQFTPPQTSQIILCTVGRPAAVAIDGQPLPEVSKLAAADKPGYEYLASARLLYIKPGPGPHLRLTVDGVRFEPGRVAPVMATAVDFSFDSDDDGWRAACDLSDPQVRNGAVAMTVRGPDPYFVRGNLDVPTEKLAGVQVRLAVPAGTRGDLQLFWSTDQSPSIDEAKSLRVPLIADGEFHDYRVLTGTHDMWKGKLTSLRIDPGGGPEGGEVRIDAVQGVDR